MSSTNWVKRLKKVLKNIIKISLKLNLVVLFWLALMIFSILNQNLVISPVYSWSTKFRVVLFWIRVMMWVLYSVFNFPLLIPYSWVLVLGLLIIPFFSRHQFWWLIIWFEISLLPIIIIIIGFGAQRVRFPAALYMITYTLLFSLPRIALVLFRDWTLLFLTPLSNLGKIRFFLISIMFIVKIPIFGLHLWLPKAHVERPTLGSIILAGVLLKIGVFGFWIISNWGQSKIQLIWFVLGGFLAALLAVVQSDLKRIIAFSSVAHLNLALAAGLTSSNLGEARLLLLSLIHGAIRSILFMMVGIRSFVSKSRLLFYLKINSSIFWLLALSFNMRLPPCPSFWPEFFTGFRLGLHSFWNLLFFFLGGLRLAWFTILNWLSLKFSSYQNLSIMSKSQLSFLWVTFVLWVNLIWFI